MKLNKLISFLLLFLVVGCANEVKEFDGERLIISTPYLTDKTKEKANLECGKVNKIAFYKGGYTTNIYYDCKEITKASKLEICEAYHDDSINKEKIHKEIKRRGVISSSEWKLINNKEIKIGMSECALLASWGKPESTNSSVYSLGIYRQYVYPSAYIYVENGKVRSWQN